MPQSKAARLIDYYYRAPIARLTGFGSKSTKFEEIGARPVLADIEMAKTRRVEFTNLRGGAPVQTHLFDDRTRPQAADLSF